MFLLLLLYSSFYSTPWLPAFLTRHRGPHKENWVGRKSGEVWWSGEWDLPNLDAQNPRWETSERENGVFMKFCFSHVVTDIIVRVLRSVEEQWASSWFQRSLCLCGWIRPSGSLWGWPASQWGGRYRLPIKVVGELHSSIEMTVSAQGCLVVENFCLAILNLKNTNVTSKSWF